jgi:hypothetical protein
VWVLYQPDALQDFISTSRHKNAEHVIVSAILISQRSTAPVGLLSAKHSAGDIGLQRVVMAVLCWSLIARFHWLGVFATH